MVLTGAKSVEAFGSATGRIMENNMPSGNTDKFIFDGTIFETAQGEVQMTLEDALKMPVGSVGLAETAGVP